MPRTYLAPRLAVRSVDELIGICRGILSDGMVLDAEANYLSAWLESNRLAADSWPGNVLFARITAMLEDGVLDENEQAEILDLLNEATGLGIPLPEVASSYATALPLCSPAPTIEFRGRSFVLTGKFAGGPRGACESMIQERGGIVRPNPAKGVDFLVIGAIGSPDWIHSTHGRKIERAVELRAAGSGIRIVSEAHWATFL